MFGIAQGGAMKTNIKEGSKAIKQFNYPEISAKIRSVTPSYGANRAL